MAGQEIEGALWGQSVGLDLLTPEGERTTSSASPSHGKNLKPKVWLLRLISPQKTENMDYVRLGASA
jgi:hypothetical protein